MSDPCRPGTHVFDPSEHVMCVECGHRVFVTEERRAIRAELLEAKEALGPAWILEGETLADGIRRKMQKLEELAK